MSGRGNGRSIRSRAAARVIATTLAAVVAVTFVAAEWPDQSASTALPPRFERVLADIVRPSASDRRRLLAGGPISTLLDSDGSREVAVFGAVWIAAARDAYVAAIRDIETFESGPAFRITRRISSPPRVEDFADLELPQEDVDDLADCRVGDCEMKLDQETIERIGAQVDFTRPTARREVEALIRERAFAYVTDYLERGNAALAVYRDSGTPRSAAAEFELMIEQMPSLDELPDIRRYLLEYPRATLPDSIDFLYWQEAEFGLKPTIRINHVVIDEAPAATVVLSKMLDANHYFWTAIELRLLIPDPARGSGFWFVNVNRSRSDGLSGFTGFFVRGRVRSRVEQGMVAALEAMRTKLEGS